MTELKHCANCGAKMPNSLLAVNLKKLRLSIGLSQKAMADLANMSFTGYKNIEKGTVDPKFKTVQALAKALNVSLADLLAPAPRELTSARFEDVETIKEEVSGDE